MSMMRGTAPEELRGPEGGIGRQLVFFFRSLSLAGSCALWARQCVDVRLRSVWASSGGTRMKSMSTYCGFSALQLPSLGNFHRYPSFFVNISLLASEQSGKSKATAHVIINAAWRLLILINPLNSISLFLVDCGLETMKSQS